MAPSSAATAAAPSSGTTCHARADLSRVSDYGRLLASLGINGCSINNVNANPRILASDFIPRNRAHRRRVPSLGRAASPSPSISAARKTIGGLDTFDPLDPKVAAWWKAKADEIYRADSRSRRLRPEGRFRRPRRPLHLQPHARRRRQRGGARAQAAWRPALLPRLRLRPPHGLEQSEERPRPRRL